MKRYHKILPVLTVIILLLGLCSFFLLKPKHVLANPGTCYWVGDTNPAVWNDASHWSSTSGGGGNTCEGGANIPQAGTAVVFNALRNNSVNVDIDVSVASITVSASTYSGTLNAQTHNVSISGNLTWGSGTLSMGSGNWTVSHNVDLRGGTLVADTGTLILNGSAASQTLTPNGQTFNNLTIKTTHASGTILAGNDTFRRYSGNLLIAGNLYLTADGASNVLLDAATYDCDVTVAGNLGFTGAGAGSKSILMGNNTWKVGGNVNFTGGTVTKGTSTLDLSGSAVQSLTLAGQALNNLRVSNSSGSDVNFVGNVSAASLTAANPSTKLVFEAGATYSFTNIDLNGQATGTKISLVSSAPGTKWILNVSGSPIVAYVNVSDSDALAGNQISAVNSINYGNNINWSFIEDHGGLAPSQNTWQFSSAEDFTLSDSSKMKFSNGSVKIIPDNFTSDWSKIWHDTHFAPDVGNSNAYSMSIDSEGNMYIGGETDNGNGGANLGYIVKLDKDFNEIWYKNDYFAGQTASEMYRSIIDDQDNFLVHGGYTDATLRSHSVLMKVSLSDGSVIWSKDIIQPAGVILISGWDRSAGPVVDSNHNIYIAMSNNTGVNNGANSEPTGIYKFDQNGNLIWNVSDLLATHVATYHYVDLWDMVVDSEGSVYLSISADPPWPAGIRWGVLKYDTNGNYKWNNIKIWAGMDEYQQGRGIAIDSEDNIYQDGNAGDGSLGAGCGIRKLDKDGNVIFEQITTDIQDGMYCWGSAVNQFDEWLVPGEYSPDTAGSYIKKYKTTDMTKIGQVTDEESPGLADGHRAIKSAFDKYGNAYALTYLQDTDYSNKYSVIVIKTKNTYPNTTPGSGTPLTLVNKTPVSYNILNGFSVEYGPMDQADVKFQISNDGEKWYFWNGLLWAETVGYGSNTEAEVNQNISKFSDQFGPGQFYFKSFMITDGTKEVDLKSVTITRDLPLGVLPTTGKDENNNSPIIVRFILLGSLIILLFRQKLTNKPNLS